MKRVLVAAFSFSVLSGYYSHAATASMKVRAIVKSNRENIYEGDIEDRPLVKGKVVESLIGSSDDLSGNVSVELLDCREGKTYHFTKRRINSSGKPISSEEIISEDHCQAGLAFMSYDLKAEDLGKRGEAIEFSFREEGSKKTVVLGAVAPKVMISAWESHLFIDEQFNYIPTQTVQSYRGVADVYLLLATAFSKVLNGQTATVDYSINKNGVVTNYHDQFVLEAGTHELEISQFEKKIEVGDIITYRYTVGAFTFSNVFKVQKDYTQTVSLKDGRLTYALVVNDVDWYMADPLSSVFKGADYNRGGRSIDVTHLVSEPLGGDVYGNYVLHMTLNGYTNLYLNTSVVK